MAHNTSVIIPTLGRPHALDRTLRTIVAGSLLPDEIIVIDQSSLETTRHSNQVALQACANRCSVVYIYQPKPSSTGARNTGLRVARNEILLFSDDDVDYGENTIGNLSKLMNDSEDMALVAGVDATTQGMGSNAFGALFFRKALGAKGRVGHVTPAFYGRYPKRIVGTVETEWAMGYFFAVRRSLVQKWGIRFDELLVGYAYAEDLDFTLRYCRSARKENRKCVLCSDVSVRHLVAPESRQSPYKRLLMSYVHREYLAHKNFGSLWYGVAVRWANFGDYLWRLLRNERPMEVVRAQMCVERHRHDIRKGKLPTQYYS